ncbi:hypothetical protein P376_0503 [Streptomyces sp. HCCB10043]|nr:hypothetical protein P376_0503 [Streptomyces sp. HCCB10043]
MEVDCELPANGERCRRSVRHGKRRGVKAARSEDTRGRWVGCALSPQASPGGCALRQLL